MRRRPSRASDDHDSASPQWGHNSRTELFTATITPLTCSASSGSSRPGRSRRLAIRSSQRKSRNVIQSEASIRDKDGQRMVQVTAPISPGSSGVPILDDRRASPAQRFRQFSSATLGTTDLGQQRWPGALWWGASTGQLLPIEMLASTVCRAAREHLSQTALSAPTRLPKWPRKTFHRMRQEWLSLGYPPALGNGNASQLRTAPLKCH